MKTLYTRGEMKEIRERLRSEGKKVVFTNGCFDIIHPGHIDYLNKAKACGDVLIVGLNSDDSVKRLKGDKRPILNEEERAFILSNLKAVDFVTLFTEDTPFNIISDLIPDYLVKGGDWALDKIVGRDIVEQNGGKVRNIEFVTNQSTTGIIETILQRYSE
jgi:D-beta-D-heptose 7-phosphate kinase/D-beta-D-heptose 1-phosphate adenosyltransferase